MNSETKICQNCKQNFTIDPEDFDFYNKVNVPPPTFCWQCRFQRRIAARNERKLFRNKSAKSGADIITLYPPASGIPVYTQEEWWADDWDQMATGRDYDFKRNFFDQLFDLVKVAPRFGQSVVNIINSLYSANASYLKNCYLLFNSNSSEDSAYGNAVDACKDSYDNSHISQSERCYECFWMTNCYECRGSSQCVDCHGMWFSKNCRGCSDCIGCVNLTKQKYCIFNVPYSKEEYEKKKAEMKLNTHSGLRQAQAKAKEFWLKFPNKCIEGIQNDNVTGAYVTNSKNVHYGYLVREGKDMKYVQYQQVPKNEDCYDISIWGENNQLAYENTACGHGTQRVKFSLECYTDLRDIEYCICCCSSSNLFGCVGIRKKEYCILNKQYSKEEYEALRAKIIQHMKDMPYTDKKGNVYKYGEFFPIELSAFGYNSSTAIQHFPLTKEEAMAQGYKWNDEDAKAYETTMQASEIPDVIEDVQDDILKQLIACESCSKAYRLIQNELTFLRSQKLPVPRKCIDCRYEARIAQRNKAFLYDRTCEKCSVDIKTSYSPDQPEIVYCEACYQAEVV